MSFKVIFTVLMLSAFCIIMTACSIDDIMDPFGKYNESEIVSLTRLETTYIEDTMDEYDAVEDVTDLDTSDYGIDEVVSNYSALDFEGLTAKEIMELYGRNRSDIFKFGDIMQMEFGEDCPYYFDFNGKDKDELDDNAVILSVEAYQDKAQVVNGVRIGMGKSEIQERLGVKLEFEHSDFDIYDIVSQYVEVGRYRILLQFDEDYFLRYAIINFDKGAGISIYTTSVTTSIDEIDMQ